MVGMTVEMPRKGSRMTSVYDPTLDQFYLAEQYSGGKVVVHERLDALALLDFALAKAVCLRAGASWTSGANLAEGVAHA